MVVEPGSVLVGLMLCTPISRLSSCIHYFCTFKQTNKLLKRELILRGTGPCVTPWVGLTLAVQRLLNLTLG